MEETSTPEEEKIMKNLKQWKQDSDLNKIKEENPEGKMDSSKKINYIKTLSNQKDNISDNIENEGKIIEHTEQDPALEQGLSAQEVESILLEVKEELEKNSSDIEIAKANLTIKYIKEKQETLKAVLNSQNASGGQKEEAKEAQKTYKDMIQSIYKERTKNR